ncbi:MAG: histidinol phosphate phosphatase domain-containing protein [Dehalococcoidia bacterium]|nr:histidinol phosphate phosphatase domain-containing protein [Dehalococcoidia bacterium]
MVYDFHTHTFLSDGVLSPLELIRRAVVRGYKAIAVTDHCGLEDQERVVPILVRECAVASSQWNILAIPGVELTHVPPSMINEAAQRAKALGARIVVVHGETVVEPVEPGTNRAALASPYVDILAHPGLLTEKEAQNAAARGVFLELSARRGHSLTNGRVAKLGLAFGASLVVDSDAHAPEDLLTEELARAIALGAGLEEGRVPDLLEGNPLQLLKRLALVVPPRG